MITYRTVTDVETFEQVTQLEMLVWRMERGDAITPHTQRIIVHTGGNIIGAFDGDAMIGCTVAFAMRGEPRLWSHIAAVHPAYQGQRIGYTLKPKQREWALEHGFQSISWTFDPMMAANANFNFHILGAHTRTYHVNFYGAMNDGINAGLPSDRFEMLWPLTEMPHLEIPGEATFLLQCSDEAQPQTQAALSDEWHFVEIPRNFPDILTTDRGLAFAWKDALRQTLKPAFEAGYEAVEFVRHTDRNWYILHRESY
jgi:predicted GNAT superfamily acetyltransferase